MNKYEMNIDNKNNQENINININIYENNKNQIENTKEQENKNVIPKRNSKTIQITGLENLSDEEETDDRTFLEKCCFYSCCCCLCNSKEDTKNFFRKGWRDYLIREGKDETNKPFRLLTNLFVNEEDSISALETIRLNPNLVSENKLRNDLEFYIPQLCTFLLFGEVKDIEEFFVFLCKVCNASFFFAHRVHWFLMAMINAAEEKKEDIIRILKMINTLFKSENAEKKTKISKFYVSNAEKFIQYIKDNNLYYLYDVKKIVKGIDCLSNIEYNDLDGYQQEIYNKFKENREIIEKYSENEYQIAKQKEEKRIQAKLNKHNNINNNINEINTDKETTNEIKKKLKANDFIIDISNFELQNIDYTYEADSDDELNDERHYSLKETVIMSDDMNENNKNSKIPPDINFISYHSSLNFIEHLCDISNELPKHPIKEQKLFLYAELTKINKKLPCNVYLPFLKDSTRNYIICHIPLEEVKIFRTKTRCPIMLTFEIIRIDETNRENEDENLQNIEQLNHSRSNTISSLGSSFRFNKKKSKNLPMSKDKLEYEYDADNLKINPDFDLSKPLMINVNSFFEKKMTFMKKDSNINNNNKKKAIELSVLPIKEGYEEDNENLDFNFINKNSLDENIKEKEDQNKRVKNIVSKFTLKASTEIDNDKTKFERQTQRPLPPKNIFKDDTVIHKNSFKIANKLIRSSKEQITSYDNKINNNENNSDINNNESFDSNSSYEEEEIQSGAINQDFFDKIFGETIEEKEKNLKKKSIFGKIETHKIFRCIFKTHEDLRQEQFATQLINEFYQIFKLENTGCWLNTYEIISTGNDSGLVEMVDNSLSLDQLKQKTKNISLKDFYINYYGKGFTESISYKNAMDNFVASLAGYSLVCYFLQIKDRHNGNILIDNKGHLIHIDFGFLLSNAPGKGLKFENAPFKLTHDMVDCLGGIEGKYFEEFRKLLKKGFLAVNKHRHKIIILVEMMWCGHGRKLECFEKGQEAINELKLRLNPKEDIHKADIFKHVDNLIGQSVDNWRTKWYDIFQYYVQGIFY